MKAPSASVPFPHRRQGVRNGFIVSPPNLTLTLTLTLTPEITRREKSLDRVYTAFDVNRNGLLEAAPQPG